MTKKLLIILCIAIVALAATIAVLMFQPDDQRGDAMEILGQATRIEYVRNAGLPEREATEVPRDEFLRALDDARFEVFEPEAVAGYMPLEYFVLIRDGREIGRVMLMPEGYWLFNPQLEGPHVTIRDSALEALARRGE